VKACFQRRFFACSSWSRLCTDGLRHWGSSRSSADFQ